MPDAPLTLDALTLAAEAGEIDTVIVAQVDMQGRLMGKRFHVADFLDHARDHTHSCNYLLTVDMEMEPVPGYKSASWAQGYGDYIMKPDLATLRRIPWAAGTALVLCDLLDHAGEAEVPVSPRAILKRQLARLADMGLSAMMASELEFYLFRQSFEEAHASGYRSLDPVSPYNEDYHLFTTVRDEPVMRPLRNGLYGAGIPVENSKGEAWAGQEEINVRYADALTAADNHVLTKQAAKEIALQAGHAVTFMAKYADAPAGSSCHVHQSLWTPEGNPAFLDAEAPHGMSALMQRYVAGLLAHLPEITLFLAPNINSYKRFVAGTFAPTRAVWSRDNRTAGFRLVGEGTKGIRIENRIGGADLNPYLAFAAQIAAGMAGIEKGLDLEPEFTGDAYAAEAARAIPATLRDAAGRANGSKMLRASFGDDVVDHYVHAAEWEQSEYDRRVTDWEVARGFERS
ncbi:glutamine synthetase family protein [Psychromarinibacter sp. C21-152]|uniref:Glutamine synthetase family protein n=1 Tax=Psychromarinibacter sediminicola TaxID=3033385 RepID=A0AAE3T8T3_9RHOB|nr:glutamine synthetase family protein [Psychromarinibacter sediminicola]MDF0601582.1 glutamine synthetase family protein [Psychromarinibacter sediminicola]